jgi:nucleotide-binding universal stress UspA family protein
MFKNILMPIDGSPLARKAMVSGVKLAKALGARVTGFYAAPAYDPQVYEDFVPANFVSPSEYRAEIVKRAAKVLAPLEKMASAEGVAFAGHHVLSNFPWESIIKAAKDKRCDAIFMASHGHRGLKGLILGSETVKVLTHSKIPVIVYR